MKVSERIRVVGVDCPSCVVSIQRELARVGAEADVDASTGYSVVRYDPSRASLQDVVRAIRDAGYDVEKRSLVFSAELGEEEAARFESEVASLRGVIECRFSPVTGLARVVYNPFSTSEGELLESVRKLGWRVEPASESVVEEGERKPLYVPLVSFALGLLAVAYHALESFGAAPRVSVAFYALLATATILLNHDLLARGFRSLARRSPTMESLIALSATVSYLFSLYSSAFAGHGSTFFEASAGVLGFVSAGKYLEERLRSRAVKALGELAALQGGKARVVRGGEVIEVDISLLRIGDVVEVHAGERIPVDGVVVEGWGYVDESTFTGEPLPSFKSSERRDAVLAGSLLVRGFLRVNATRVGRDTSLAHIIEVVRESQFRKPGFQRVADRIVGFLTWIVIALSLASFAYWSLSGADFATAAMFAAAVLAVTCPCPLGIAVPLVAALASIKAARIGVLVRGGDVFERALKVDTVVFDKTGTLTSGSPRLSGAYSFNGFSEADLLKLAGSAEVRSEHPLARAVLDKCRELGLQLREPSSYDHLPGMGVIAEVDGTTVAVGSQKLVEQLGVVLQPEAAELIEKLRASGATVLLVAVNGVLAGALEVRDEIKPEAGEVVSYLKREKLRTVLMTGDTEAAGRWVAEKLGLDEVHAELKPEDKAERVEEMQRSGRRVLFVGDGVNDAPAIGKAFLGVAVGKGAEIAKEAGDAVLVSGSLRALVLLRELGKAVRRKALENLAWAFTYNAALVPVAMGLFYRSHGLLLKPEMAAAAMILSDISVVVNALTLLRFNSRTLEA
ncbi:MAG: heavy metal translocating P-type ATPase [Thermofilum sp.]